MRRRREIGDQDALAVLELARRHQRRGRPDRQRAHDDEPRYEERVGDEEPRCGQCRLAPCEAPPRRGAGSGAGDRTGRAGGRRQAVRVRGHGEQRQSQHEQDHRAGEHPVRQRKDQHGKLGHRRCQRRGGHVEPDRPPGAPARRLIRQQRSEKDRRDAGPAARRGQRVERRHHVVRRLRPVVGALLQAPHHQVRERPRQVAAHGLDRDRFLGQVGDEQLLRRTSAEWRRPRQHLVRQDAERVEVGARVGVRVGGGLLRRHVGRRPQRHAHLRDPAVRAPGHGVTDRLGHAKVGDGGRAARQQHIVRLDIAVDDALAMRVGKGRGDVAQQAHRFGHRERPRFPQPGAQRVALHERHREVRNPVDLARRQQRHDVRMLQPRRRHDLALEPVDAHPGEVRRQHLDHDLATERLLARQKDA